MKNFISLFLALIMILSIGTVGVSAASYSITLAPTLDHVRKDNMAYYPVRYDLHKSPNAYAEFCASNGVNAVSTHIELGYTYDAETLKFVDVLPSETLYNAGGTIKVKEQGTDKYGDDYFIVEIDFTGTEALSVEYFFNLQFEVLQEKFFYSGVAIARTLVSHYPVYEDIENYDIRYCFWNVTDSNGEVHDLSKNVYTSYIVMTEFMEPDYNQLLIKDYEPFIPPVSTTDYMWISTSHYGAKVDNYLYFPVFYDDDQGYARYVDENSKTKITFPFFYDPEFLKPVDVTPSELIYGMNFTGEISVIDVYTYIGKYGQEIPYPYFYVEITFDGGAEIENGDILFNVKLELIGENASNEGGYIFDSYFIVEDLENSVRTCAKWEITDGNGIATDLSSAIQHNYRPYPGETEDYLTLKGYEPFIPPVEEGKLTADTKFESGETYYINNYSDLKTLAYLVNEKGESTAGVTFVQTADIVANSGTFSLDENNAPLYNGSSDLPEAFTSIENFSGIFDGQNYTISGLYLNAGLFENCEGAEIKNIYIENSLVLNESDTLTALGTVSSVFADSTLTGCSVDAIVIGKGANVGGALGNVTGSTVKYCRNLGNVFGGTNVGGMAGSFEACTVSACYNAGSIYGEDYVGGFAGGITDCDYVGNSYNTGKVEVSTTSGYAGGFVGYLIPKTVRDYSLSKLYTVGEVSGRCVGNFCGAFAGSLYNIFDMEDCYFIGDSVEEFDSSEMVSVIWEMYQKDHSIVYPPGTLYPAVELYLDVYPTTEANLKNNKYISSEFVLDAANENDGYPMLKYFHKAHTYSDYTVNEDGTSEVAKCNSTNCPEIDSRSHTHTWGEYVKGADGNLVAECLYEGCNFTDVKEVEPLFEFGVTAQHIRNKFDMVYYPASFGFSMYDDADIRYSDICADVADLAFGCDTEVVMKYIYDATTLDFVSVYEDFWEGSVEVLEHGSTGETGPDGQEYNYIVIKAKFIAVGYANDTAPYYLKFAVIEDNFINSDGTVRKVIDNVPYSEDQLCVWNAWDAKGNSFDFSDKIKFKSSDYETDGYTYDNLLLEDDLIPTDVSMPTVTFTPEHARKDDLAYYPCMYDSNVDYEEWVHSATGFKDSTTKIQIKVNYDSSTLELLDALPSKELYDLGGTVTIIETGDLYPDDPNYSHIRYAVVQIEFDALDFEEGCLFSLKFRVLQENFLDEEGRPIDLVNSFVADWVVTNNDGKSHDLRYYVSSSYVGFQTFGSYEELILADYEPFDPIFLSDVTEVTYVQQEDTHKTFTVTVNGRKQMIQFIEPDGGTRTYDRYNKNVTITSYNADGQIVSAMARDLAYEVWEIYSNMSVGVEIQVRGKENYKWDEFRYSFTIEPYNPIISMELSATSGKKGAIPATVVADAKTEKVMFKMPNGTSVTVSTFTTDENGNHVFTGKAWMNENGTNEIQVLIRRDNVWKPVGTLEYTVE